MNQHNPANQLFQKMVDSVVPEQGIRFHLIRHGETDWNAKQLFQGQQDIPLNPNGTRQVKLLVPRIRRIHVARIITSNLSRAAETAEILGTGLDLKIDRDQRWNELSFGDWEGYDYFTIQEKFPDVLNRWQADPIYESAPNGESINKLAERVTSAFRDLLQFSGEGDTLIVAHGGPLQILLCLLLDLPLSKYWQLRLNNASHSSVSIYQNGPVINFLNTTSHLETKESASDD